MSTPEPKGKFGLLSGLNDRGPAEQQNVLTAKPQTVENQPEAPKYARFSNYLRPELHERLQLYVAARKRTGFKLITAFNEAIEEYLDRHGG